MKLKFVRNTDLPHSLGPVIIQRTGWDGYKSFSIYLFLRKGLSEVFIIKLIKYKKDRPHGIVSNSIGIIKSIILSISAQLDNVVLT